MREVARTYVTPPPTAVKNARESRKGETFILGATTWRIENISHDRVTVVPAPGEPGRMPFWKGDGPGLDESSPTPTFGPFKSLCQSEVRERVRVIQRQRQDCILRAHYQKHTNS